MTDPITTLRRAVARATDEAMCADNPDMIRAQVLALGAEVLVALPFVTGDAMTARALAAEERADAADALDLDYPAREALWKMRDERDAARDARHLLAVRVTQATQAGDDPAAVDATPEGAVEAVRALRDERDRMWAARDKAAAEVESLRGELDALAEKLGAATMERDMLSGRVEWLRSELDPAIAEAERLRDLPRIGHPTRAEWDAHRATGGEWLCVHRLTGYWDCGVAMLHSDRADLWHIPMRDGAPCLWPVAAAEGGA